ncbi:albusnodin family lasso peptide [Streptomyces sp. P1-3]
MELHSDETIGRKREEHLAPPAVIELGDAAALTKGSSSQSVESKQTPYS